MRFAATTIGITMLIGISAATLLAAEPSYAASGEEAITARQNFMKEDIDRYWRPIAAYAKSGGAGSLSDVEKNALALAKLAEKMPEHFPKDTGRGNYPDKMTSALAVIWKDPEGFNKAVKDFASGSEKLARLAKDGDKDGVIALVGTTGSYNRTNLGCQGCHDKFRGPRAKE